MTDPGDEDSKPVRGPVQGLPREDLPTFFADMITTLSKGPGLVKFYLAKIDPPLDGFGESRTTPVAQVVMPVGAFANAAVFFDAQMELLLLSGEVDRETIERSREAFRKIREHV